MEEGGWGKISPVLEKIVVLIQFKMTDLCDIYDCFQLGQIVSIECMVIA